MIYLTRGGLTKRQGSSDRIDPLALVITGGTDGFGPFMETLPEHLLEQGASMEDGGGEGPRREWRFELAGGMNSIVYDIAYHSGSASLPDEFADMVVVAERLTHSWYTAAVAEETGVPIPSVAKPVAPPPPRAASSSPRKAAGKRPGGAGVASPGQLVPATRERIALAILLDLFAWTIPYSFLAWLFVGGSQRSGPPGEGLVLFAIVEFLLLQIARKSPGYWLLGISAPVGERPQVDSTWHTRESQVTLATGGGALWVGRRRSDLVDPLSHSGSLLRPRLPALAVDPHRSPRKRRHGPGRCARVEDRPSGRLAGWLPRAPAALDGCHGLG